MAEQPCVQVTSRPAARVAAVEGRGWIGTVRDIGSMIDDLVDQIEGPVAELERQMSDPA